VSRRSALTPEEAIEFAKRFRVDLPGDWGFLCFEDDDGQNHLILTETEPPAPTGWMMWLGKRLAGGEVLRGAVFFRSTDEPRDVEARAWVVLGLLLGREGIAAARWN
jgi:hypothetical protein